MNSSHPRLIRLAASTAGFFLAFITFYAAMTLLLVPAGGGGTPGDLAAVALAAAGCLLLWRIPLRGGGSPFNYPGSRSGAVLCCAAVTATCAVRWPTAGLAMGGLVLTALISAVLEELVCRRVPVVLLKRSGRNDLPATATAGGISTAAFVLLHQNTDPWLIADKIIFSVVAFSLALATANLLLPVLIHLASNLLLTSALQAGLVNGNAALLALDCLLMGAVVAAVFMKTRKRDHLPRMIKTR